MLKWIFFVLILFWKPNQSPILSEWEIVQIIELSSAKIIQRWELGDFGEALGDTCPQFKNPIVNKDQFLRCNPSYLECFFSGKAGVKDPSFPVKWKGKTYYVYASKKESFVEIVGKNSGALAPDYGVLLRLKVEGIEHFVQEVVLENSCHMTYLPQRLYFQGQWMWDNFYQYIFVDKYLVTNRDVHEWKKEKMGDNPSFPSGKLSLEDMEKFCAFRGKQLMTAHIYDASTFYPTDLSNSILEIPPQSYVPWTNSIYKGKVNCTQIYSRECKNHEDMFALPTWMGMFQILGGYPEYLDNKIHPSKNLKLSSFYLYPEDSNQKLGQRGEWEGDHFLNSTNPPLDEQLKIGFRCYKYQ